MKFHLDPPVVSPKRKIHYREKILLTGSCFTEHIGNSLERLKFPVMLNPHGILFDPLSITSSITDYIHQKSYDKTDLVEREGIWYSWKHHGRFSSASPDELLKQINTTISKAQEFLKQARWLILTFGTAYSYRLVEKKYLPVANCHKVPREKFVKKLLSIEEIETALDNCFHQLKNFNKAINIILTVSPVRHIRDGLIENNRSKARLLEAVHHLEEKFDDVYYFPAYELVMDVLRDYRFYDNDLVHPNAAATEYVFQNFMENFFDEDAQNFAGEMKTWLTAVSHRPIHADSREYRKFKSFLQDKMNVLKVKYPETDFSGEMEKFENS